MIRALISASTFPLTLSDAVPRFVYDLAEAIAQRCEVTALAPSAPGVPLRERMGPVEVHRFPYFFPCRWQSLAYRDGMRHNLRHSVLAKLQSVPFLGAQIRATRRLVQSRSIEVVNSHWIVPQGLSTALARGAAPRFEHILTVHAGDVYLLQRIPCGGAIARFVFSRTDHVFAVGSHVRDSLDELLGYDSHAMLEPIGVRSRLFLGDGLVRQAPATPFPDGYLLFFGRFAEKKGVVYLLRAMPEVLKWHPRIGLVLIGYGPLEQELRRQVVRLRIGESVTFAGRQPHEQIARYLHGCRLAVVPSIVDRYGETEGMPTVVLEALASGTRVVGSAVDGIPDVIRHGHNGWLCREKDARDLAAKILSALEDPPHSRVVQRALETASRFDVSNVAERYVDIFERLVAGEGRARSGKLRLSPEACRGI